MANWRISDNFSDYPTGTPKLVSALGDSITGGLGEWDELLDAKARATVTDKGTGGDTFADANNVGASVENRFTADVITFGADWVIVQAGVNDMISAAVDTDPNPNMEAAAAAMVSAALSNGIRIDFMNTTPFGNHVSYSAQREGYRVAWNAWLLSYCATNNIKHYDIASVLADPTDSTVVLAAYDNGDGLHPNGAGAQAIADLVWLESSYDLTQDA